MITGPDSATNRKPLPFAIRAVEALAALAFSALTGCRAGKRPTVQGPESPGMVAGLRGYVVMNGPGGEIDAVALPSLAKAVVRAGRDTDNPNVGTVEALSGPDSEGRIVFIDNFMFQKRFELKTIRLDGKDEQVLFARPGDALWDHVVSEQIGLAPIGGKLAFASDLRNAQMRNPSALLMEGPLEVWDLDHKAGRALGITALDDLFSWFPDGRRLAYVSLVSPARVPTLRLQPDKFGKSFARWRRLPAVHVLDTETGATTLLHVGWRPVVSADGKSALVQDFDDRWRLVDVGNRTSRPVSVPGAWSHALALLDGRIALYWALPTEGAKPGYTESNSPLVGPKSMMTIKAAEIDTSRFETVAPFIDPRRKASYGSGR